MRDRVAAEDVGNKDLEFMFVVAGVGQNIRALGGQSGQPYLLKR